MAHSAVAACRICLAVDVRLFAIAGSLQTVFETLTRTTLHTADGRPVVACNICYAQLKKCNKLLLTSTIAEKVLTAIFNTFSEIPEKSISQIDRLSLGLASPLAVSATEHTDSKLLVPVVIKTELDAAECETENVASDEFSQSADVTGDRDVAWDVRGLSQLCKEEIDINEDEIGKDVTGNRDMDWDSGDDRSLSQIKEEIDVKEEEIGKDPPQPADEARVLDDADNPHDEDPEHGPEEDGASTSTSKADKAKSVDADTSKRQRKSGKNSKTPTGEGPHQCNFCQRHFKPISQLKRHLMTHTGEKPFECKHCHKCFISKFSLKTHLRTHTGEKPFECKDCHQWFGRKGNLKEHLRIHTGEKPFECKVCHHRFSHKASLKKHLRSHSSEKQFECDVCQQRLRQKSYLISHFKIHTDEKPFKCDVCQHRFRNKCVLVSHSKLHSDEKPFVCDVCQHRFRLRSYLVKHLKKNHNEEKPI